MIRSKYHTMTDT